MDIIKIEAILSIGCHMIAKRNSYHLQFLLQIIQFLLLATLLLFLLGLVWAIFSHCRLHRIAVAVRTGLLLKK